MNNLLLFTTAFLGVSQHLNTWEEAIIRTMAQGRGAPYAGQMVRLGEIRSGDGTTITRYQAGSFSISVGRTDNRMAWVICTPPMLLETTASGQAMLTVREAEDLLRERLEGVGISVKADSVELLDGSPQRFEGFARQLIGGIPRSISHELSFTIDARSGVITQLSFPKPPSAYGPNRAPQVSAVSAVGLALDRVLLRQDVMDGRIVRSPELVWFEPAWELEADGTLRLPPPPHFSELSLAEVAQGNQGRARLAWSFSFLREVEGSGRVLWDLWIDPFDQRVLMAYRVDLANSSFGGVSARAPFIQALGPTLTISRGQSIRQCGAGELHRTSGVAGFRGSAPFWLGYGNLWFRVQFDPVLNRLALGGGKDRWFARPNAELRRALLGLAKPKPAPIRGT